MSSSFNVGKRIGEKMNRFVRPIEARLESTGIVFIIIIIFLLFFIIYYLFRLIGFPFRVRLFLLFMTSREAL